MQTREVSMLVPQALSVLRERLANHMVVTAYLPTQPRPGEGPTWLFALQAKGQEIRTTLADGMVEEFDAALQVAESFLTRPFVPEHPGLALFATAEQGGYAMYLPAPP